MSSDFSEWSKKNQRRVIWIIVVGLLIVWIFLMGGLSDINNFLLGGPACNTSWDEPIVDGPKKTWCNKVYAGGAPVRMARLSKGDSFKIYCSGHAEMTLKYSATGFERRQVGCEGYNTTPWKLKERSEANGYQFDLSQWPQHNAPMLGAICQQVPTGSSFPRHQWYQNQKWAYLKHSSFTKRMDAGKMLFDGWVYCWINAPRATGNASGEFKFELVDIY